MNHRVGIIIAIFAFFGALVWWRSHRTSPSRSEPASATPSPATETSQSSSTPTVPATYEIPRSGEYQGRSDPRWEWWKEMGRRDPKFEWKMPINFYGKVIDQAGQPVQGATVRLQWTDMSEEGTTEKFAETDSQGMFSLVKETGKRLLVFVSKDGYHAVQGGRGSYEYAAFFEPNYIEPDPENPVVFQLVKKIDAETMVVGNALKRLSYDDGQYYYDLWRGSLDQEPPTAAGLKFTFARNKAMQGQPFDWSWTIEGINTKVRVTTDEFPQVAPTDNCVPSWKIEQAANTGAFQRQVHVRFYFRTADDRYGRVDLELSHPNAREVGPTLSVKSQLNPSGSRNLEYDPSEDES